jgi:putative membrane protein
MSRYAAALATALAVILIASGAAPYDRLTWVMETLPVMIALPLLVLTHRRFPLTNFLYTLIFVHCLVLIVGGIYTYARVPAGFWVQHAFDLPRNPYDKLGHFLQGFVPALIARELFIRNSWVRGRHVQAFLCVCVAMFISSVYELIEWQAAVFMGQGADEFLGTQGDVWDTQSDMACALLGSSIAVLFFSSFQDRAISRLVARSGDKIPGPSASS